MKPEAKFQLQLIDALKEKGLSAYHLEPTNHPGWPDLLVLDRDNHYLFLELKFASPRDTFDSLWENYQPPKILSLIQQGSRVFLAIAVDNDPIYTRTEGFYIYREIETRIDFNELCFGKNLICDYKGERFYFSDIVSMISKDISKDMFRDFFYES